MKKTFFQKKLFSMVLSALLLLMALPVLEGCGSSTDSAAQRIAVVTGVEGTNGNSIFTDIWAGANAYARENMAETVSYTVTVDDIDAYKAAMDQAAEDGADVIISAGSNAGMAVFEMQRLHRQTRFLLLGSTPTDPESGKEQIRGNTSCLTISTEQAGFLAGYAAVMNGYTNLGFLGGYENDANSRYASGYLQGIQRAAEELGLAQGTITVRCRFIGDDSISPALVDEITEWYTSGTQVIYACGDGPLFLARAGTQNAGGGMIIDTDMENLSDDGVILTSAGMDYQQSTYQALNDWRDGQLKGGAVTALDASQGCVGIQLNEGTWQNFTAEQYQAVVQKLASGEIKISSETVEEIVNNNEINLINLITN